MNSGYERNILLPLLAHYEGVSSDIISSKCYRQVTLVELSKSSPSLPEILSGIGSSVMGIDMTLKQLMDGLTSSDGVQARMDGIMFQRSEGSSFANPIFNFLKDYLSSL